mgnify:FL=1
MISKTEMRSYFIRAKYHDLKGEFKHDFHETTYFKPTFCVHCTGLLWGLIKQGWKCKDCGINAHRHCKDQVVMECRQKRPHTVNKQGSVTDSRPSRNSFRIRKTRKQKATQTEDINFSSSTSSATSESCTSSSDDEHPHQHSLDKSTHHNYWHLRKPSSLKRRKQILSDSNDDYYYTHPPSPQQASSLTTITTVNSSTSTNILPIQQLIPRGPLICSDSFEKWNDRPFTWNRPLPSTNLLTPIPSVSEKTTDTSLLTTDHHDQTHQQPLYGQGSFLEGDVSDDDTCFTSNLTDTTIPPIRIPSNYGSSQNLNCRKLSLTESLRSLPTKSDPTQVEIFERLRQAEEDKKRLEVENRAMKQELVRTKSKICSLKREMSSIQQLHLAQQQVHVHAQLSAPTIVSHHLHPTDQSNHYYLLTNDFPNLSLTNSDQTTEVTHGNITNTSSSTQTPPLNNPVASSSTTTTTTNVDSTNSPSDEQLRLYLTETLQREKDSAV